MSRSSLNRRIDKIAANFFCPHCGYRLRDRDTATPEQQEQEQQTVDGYRRFFRDASTEDLQQIEDILKRTQRQHNDACRARGDQPYVMYPMGGETLATAT